MIIDDVFVVEDDIYPESPTLYYRKSVRAFPVYEGRIYLNHILTTDMFGKRDHYETPGGGVEENETSIEAIVRELKEELGAKTCKVIPLGRVGVQYHVLQKIDISEFYIAEISDFEAPNLTSYELDVLQEPTSFTYDELLEILSHPKMDNVEKIIYQREALMLKKARKYFKGGD